MFSLRKRIVVSLQIDDTKCIGCEECVDICRRKVIEMFFVGDRYIAKIMYPEDCKGCGKCTRVCASDAIKLITA